MKPSGSTVGAPVLRLAMVMVVSALSAPAGTTTRAPSGPSSVPPAGPISALASVGAGAGPSPPPQAASSANTNASAARRNRDLERVVIVWALQLQQL